MSLRGNPGNFISASYNPYAQTYGAAPSIDVLVVAGGGGGGGTETVYGGDGWIGGGWIDAGSFARPLGLGVGKPP